MGTGKYWIASMINMVGLQKVTALLLVLKALLNTIIHLLMILLTELADNFLEEKHRSRNIARNTKFVVREMTGMSNKDYKVFLKKFREREEMRCYDWVQCFEDIINISGFELDHEVILEAAIRYDCSIHHLNKALLKLKEKLNEGR